MAKGGKRAGAGRPKNPPRDPVQDRSAAARIIEGLNRDESPNDPTEITRFRDIEKAGARESLELRKWLYDKRDGKPVQTVNHVHDKPIEMNVTLSLAETIAKARKRAGKA